MNLCVSFNDLYFSYTISGGTEPLFFGSFAGSLRWKSVWHNFGLWSTAQIMEGILITAFHHSYQNYSLLAFQTLCFLRCKYHQKSHPDYCLFYIQVEVLLTRPVFIDRTNQDSPHIARHIKAFLVQKKDVQNKLGSDEMMMELC